MDTRQWLLRLAATAAAGLMLCAQAPSPAPTGSALELEEFLYIQNPHPDAALKGAVYVLWIPQPVMKYCSEKTAEQCIAIDFCIRTTSKQVSMCQNLSVNVTKLSRYPNDTGPRRVLSITYFPRAPVKGLDTLLQYFNSNPKATFDRLSPNARIKARVKLIRSATDDQFELLEVLAVPPL
jgi:hypothetical protein